MILVAALAAGAAAAPVAGAPADLVPRPRSVAPRAGTAEMIAQWTVSIETRSPGDSAAVATLIDEGIRRGGRWRLSRGRPWARQVIVRRSSFGGAEGYRLEIGSRRITIEAATAAGRFYAIQTLRQMVRGSATGVVDACLIEDVPSLALRGVSLDVSRGQMPRTGALERAIRELAYYKVNTLVLYIEDSFQFASAPLLRRNDRLTPADVRRLRAVARAHHVELMPLLQTLGHQERLLAIPEYAVFAENPPRITLGMRVRAWLDATFALERKPAPAGQAPQALCPVDPAAEAFVRRLLADVDAAFESKRIHVGGDEAWEVGTGRSAEAVRRQGRNVVLGEYWTRLRAHLEGRGRRMMLFADMIDLSDGALAWPRDVDLVWWNYDPAATFQAADSLAAAGFGSLVLNAGLWDWRTFYPAWDRAFPNIANAATAAKRGRRLGLLASSWGDGGAESLLENDWAGFAYAASSAWGEETRDPAVFLARFAVVHGGAVAAPLAEVERLLGWRSHGAVPLDAVVYHQRPDVEPRDRGWLEHMKRLKADMRRAGELLETWGPKVAANRAHVAALRHAVRRLDYLADRELLLHEAGALAVAAGPTAGATPARRTEQSLASLLRRHELLASDYGRLWLESARPGGLPANLRRLELQKRGLHRLLDQARTGKLRPLRPFPAGDAAEARNTSTRAGKGR